MADDSVARALAAIAARAPLGLNSPPPTCMFQPGKDGHGGIDQTTRWEDDKEFTVRIPAWVFRVAQLHGISDST